MSDINAAVFNDDEKISSGEIRKGSMLDRPLTIPDTLLYHAVACFAKFEVDLPSTPHNYLFKCRLKFMLGGILKMEVPLNIAWNGIGAADILPVRGVINLMPNVDGPWQLILGPQTLPYDVKLRPFWVNCKANKIEPELLEWSVNGGVVATGFRFYMGCYSSANPVPL